MGSITERLIEGFSWISMLSLGLWMWSRCYEVCRGIYE